jgi:hypothetical protein
VDRLPDGLFPLFSFSMFFSFEIDTVGGWLLFVLYPVVLSFSLCHRLFGTCWSHALALSLSPTLAVSLSLCLAYEPLGGYTWRSGTGLDIGHWKHWGHTGAWLHHLFALHLGTQTWGRFWSGVLRIPRKVYRAFRLAPQLSLVAHSMAVLIQGRDNLVQSLLHLLLFPCYLTFSCLCISYCSL